jgi:transposase InsO family protein
VTDAFPWDKAPSHLIRDRDRAFGPAYTHRIRAMGIRDHPTAPRSPWQNGYVERLTGSIRRESLDHLIVFDEAQLRRVLKNYASYYRSGRISHCTRMHRIFAARISLATSLQYQSSADSIINTSGFRF